MLAAPPVCRNRVDPPSPREQGTDLWSSGLGGGARYADRVVRIAIGSDHAGFRLKEHLKQVLEQDGHEVDDLGTRSEEPVDYPPICAAVGRKVADGAAERGIVLGGSGQGEQIAANKVPGVRAALCNDVFTARLSREHNDANVLSMGGRIVGEGMAGEILRLWLATAFDGGRHARRVAQIADIEKGASA
jgi:ribose 5-phosphate isomerase B